MQDLKGNAIKAKLLVDGKEKDSLDFSSDTTGQQHLGVVTVTDSTSIEMYPFGNLHLQSRS